MPQKLFSPAAIQSLVVSTGLSPKLVTVALHNALDVVTPKFLKTIPRADVRKNVLIICPSNVFTAWLHPAIIALTAGHEVWLKSSAHEQVFPRLWKESLSAEQSARVKIVAWTPAVRQASDFVIAYGSDATIKRLKEECSTQPLIGFGHQVSVGVIFKEALAPKRLKKTREAARAAIEPFRLQGCLSPQTIYIESREKGVGGREFWESLSSSLTDTPLPTPHFFADHSELFHHLRAIPSRLACLGWEGDQPSVVRMASTLKHLGFFRICPLAEMQRPPLTWANGGTDLINWFQQPWNLKTMSNNVKHLRQTDRKREVYHD